MTQLRARTVSTTATSRPSTAPRAAAPAQGTLATRNFGNQALQAVLRRGAVQATLTVNQPGDAYEREADRVAEDVFETIAPAARENVFE